MKRALFLAAAVALLPATCFAGAAEVVACRELKEDAARLACFDRTTEGLAADLEAQQHKSLTERFGLSAPKPRTEQEFGAGTVPAPKETKPAKQAESHPVPKDQAAAAPQATRPPEVRSITARIERIDFNEGKPVFHLDNGQIWAAQETRRVMLNGDGNERALVKRRLLGYFLIVNDSKVEISVVRVR